VNKANFFGVLLGDSDATGGKPVLKSDKDSKVFVYFVDHGGAGLICTPQGSSDWIYADELDATLATMFDNGMFGELVFYLEACESGSMFPNLTEYQNIYAITASNATQSSWGAYCGSEAYVDGVNIGSCLGDLFSINWMEDTEANDPAVETLAEQTATVTTLTNRSPVQKFGTEDFTFEPIGDFQGIDSLENSFLNRTFGKMHKTYQNIFA
jgi:legumain